MKIKEIIERSQKFAAPYRVTNGKKFRLKDIDPGDTGAVTSEDKLRQKSSSKQALKYSSNCRMCFTRRISGRFC